MSQDGSRICLKSNYRNGAHVQTMARIMGTVSQYVTEGTADHWFNLLPPLLTTGSTTEPPSIS